MGRPRKHGKHLPRHVYQKNGGYYLRFPSGTQKWFGRDLPRLMAEWARVYGEADQCRTLDEVLDQYVIMELPQKAKRTQSDYQKYMARLRPVFGHCRPDDLLPKHFNLYHRRRSAKAPTQANRELSFLKSVYRFAICEGWATENPVSYVRRNRETPRDRYVTDDEYQAVYNLAPPVVRVAMAMSALTGMRQGDVLSLKRSAFHDDGIHWRQSKTGKKMHVLWSDALRQVVADAAAIYEQPRILFVSNRAGGAYTSDGFRSLWHHVMVEASKQGIEWFTFHDLRGKAGSDTNDWRLLGQSDRKVYERHYNRKTRPVKPVR